MLANINVSLQFTAYSLLPSNFVQKKIGWTAWQHGTLVFLLLSSSTNPLLLSDKLIGCSLVEV